MPVPYHRLITYSCFWLSFALSFSLPSSLNENSSISTLASWGICERETLSRIMASNRETRWKIKNGSSPKSNWKHSSGQTAAPNKESEKTQTECKSTPSESSHILISAICFSIVATMRQTIVINVLTQMSIIYSHLFHFGVYFIHSEPSSHHIFNENTIRQTMESSII